MAEDAQLDPELQRYQERVLDSSQIIIDANDDVDVNSEQSNLSWDEYEPNEGAVIIDISRGGFTLDDDAGSNGGVSFGHSSFDSQYSSDIEYGHDDEVADFRNTDETPLLGYDVGELTRPQSKWELARSNLAYLQKPNASLLCREVEHEKLSEMLTSMLRWYDESYSVLGGVIFIAGVPGTGKTATMRIVASQLRSKMPPIEIHLGSVTVPFPPFYFLEVNALKLSDPKMIYTHLWWVICSKVYARDWQPTEGGSNALYKEAMLSKTAAQAKLDNFFRGMADDTLKQKVRVPILLLLDEIETLMTKDQEILYTLFEWARLPTAKLVIVGIANMLDLAERVHQKINSRIGTNRIIFSPYQPSQLKEILLQKMQHDLHFFEDESVIDYIAKKVGSSKGDARLTFEVCSRSLRFAELHSNAKDPTGETIIPVNNKIVDQTIFAMRDNARLVALESTSLHERIWMLAVLFEIGARRRLRTQVTQYQRRVIGKEALLKLDDDVTFQDTAYTRYTEFCAQLALTPHTSTIVQTRAQRLFQLSIFLPNWSNHSLQRAIYLKLDPEIILTSLYPDRRIRKLFDTHQFAQMYFLSSALE